MSGHQSVVLGTAVDRQGSVPNVPGVPSAQGLGADDAVVGKPDDWLVDGRISPRSVPRASKWTDNGEC